MAQMRGAIPEGAVSFIPSEIDGSLWYIVVGERRAGAIICYVDDLLIAGEMPAIYTDSQAALAVCKSAAGSWRTRHLRIRGSLVRELLELPDWIAHHVDGRIMLADLGTKALASDRFNLLVDRMRVLRKRQGGERKRVEPAHVKKLLTLLCLTALVECGEAAEIADREPFDYLFVGLCSLAVIAMWEGAKTLCVWLAQCCGSTGWSRRAEEPTGPAVRTVGREGAIFEEAVELPQLSSSSVQKKGRP
eukprot:s8640_g2.t1